MGCDIHGWLEIRTGESWRAAHKVPRDRTYDMFGILAGVRNYVNAEPISEPRGLDPEDLSFWAKDDYNGWLADAHGASWLNWKDISEYDWTQISMDGRVSVVNLETGEEKIKASYINPSLLKEDEKFDYLSRVAKDLIPLPWEALFNEMEFYANRLGNENVRIVFWFDN